MKKYLLLLIFLGGFIAAQMPNISSVWMNNSQPYVGTITAQKIPMKVKINISEQDKKKDQEYFISGFFFVENTPTKFERKLKNKKNKVGNKKKNVFGEYQFAEEGAGKHSGVLKGKFIYTFLWNKKTEKIENQFIEFIGSWKSYDGKLDYPTNWKNQ